MDSGIKEKPISEHVEDISGHDNDVNSDTPVTTYDAAFAKRVTRKLDIRLLIILGALYSIALIDRTNLGAARIGGMAASLKLTVGERYSIATLAFFPPYILLELPSNILLRKVGARNLLVTIAVLWGAVTVSMGFIKTWQQLVALRVVLGVFEAGFFPGCVYLISTWYTRWQTQTRLSLFYLLSMFISGFSQILAWGFINMPRAGPIFAWRWIFVMLGIITIVLGLIAAFLIIDFPDKNTFLTREETKFVMDRLDEDRGDAMPDKMTGRKVVRHLTDWRTWSYGICFGCATLPSYAFSYFLPVILAGQGYSVVASLCLSAPPYAAAAIYTFIVAISSDKLRQRGLFVCANAVVCIVGCAIVGYAGNKDVRYFGSFLAIMGAQANVPSVLAYQANNTVTHSKKAVASAITIGSGGIGGILASVVYRQADYPRYIPGLWVTIGAQFVIMILVTTLTFLNKRVNRQLDEGTKEPIEGIQGYRYSI